MVPAIIPEGESQENTQALGTTREMLQEIAELKEELRKKKIEPIFTTKVAKEGEIRGMNVENLIESGYRQSDVIQLLTIGELPENAEDANQFKEALTHGLKLWFEHLPEDYNPAPNKPLSASVNGYTAGVANSADGEGSVADSIQAKLAEKMGLPPDSKEAEALTAALDWVAGTLKMTRRLIDGKMPEIDLKAFEGDSWEQTQFELLAGREAQGDELKIFNALLTLMLTNGGGPLTGHVPRSIATANVGLDAPVRAGLLSVGPRHGGAGLGATKLFQQAINDPEVKTLEDFKKLLKSKNFPGFGHPVFTRDPRTKFMLNMAGEMVPERIRGLIDETEKFVDSKLKGRGGLNVDGAGALMIALMKLDPRLGEAVFLLARAFSSAAFALEGVRPEENGKAPSIFRAKVDYVHEPREVPEKTW